MTRRGRFNLLVTGLLLVAIGLDLFGGAHWFSPLSVISPGTSQAVLLGMRFPRTLCALMVGALLAVGGLLLQTVSHNPIADPSILGINAGATLALVIGGVSGVALTVGHAALLALIGAGLAYVIVLLLAVAGTGVDPLRLLLGGTVFSGFISCLTYAISVVTNTTQAFRNLLIGGFSGVDYGQVSLLAVATVIVVGLTWLNRASFTLMALDHETFKGLGASLPVLWGLTTIVIMVAAASSVAVAGNIGFVGLGVPQLVNAIIPGSFKQNLGPTLLTGAGFMTLADFCVKGFVAGTELPLAALSAIIGGVALFGLVAFGQKVIRL
ncbi:iron chelate uptake ABC transporter family permease subunit [Secundilactobacillus kimchicus]|uniref:iron ABC transporter permease n=1 Tax=Secundilactobacillus kimchicus TaxID=528209 RepID=UPI001C009037|nr:iron ABC transporter permease [Secundilactobacillus kimchicus]MBT9670661.1 iron chelate uptake ABC transporter family permease subunit [Secundilactobacillus kimchicus]